MEVKPGYKQTEVGVIPEEWVIKTIHHLLDEKSLLDHLDGNHGELYPRSHEFKSEGVPYIGANDFSEGTVSFDNCKFLSKERATKFRKGVAKDGDVLFAHNATVGPVALLKTDEPFVILSTTATYFRCNEDKLNNKYLKAALRSSHFIKQYQAIMAQSTRFQVPITAQRTLSLILPHILEQKGIATTLSDADARVSSLDNIIAKKRDLKQAAMQELLIGKRRLPGFEGKWIPQQLKKYVKDFIVPMRDKPKFFGGIIPWCRIEDFDGKYLFGSKSGQYVEDTIIKEMNLKVFPSGTLLVSCSADLGRCAIVGKPLVTNQTFIGLIVDESSASNEFLYYYMTFKAEELNNLSSGTTISYLSREQFETFIMQIPPTKEEQRAIATILSDMDAEIAALEQQRDKMQNIKQGMMQELLTGRIRLI